MLDRRLQREGRSFNVFIWTNISGEASKYGLAPEDVSAAMREMPVFNSMETEQQAWGVA